MSTTHSGTDRRPPLVEQIPENASSRRIEDAAWLYLSGAESACEASPDMAQAKAQIAATFALLALLQEVRDFATAWGDR